VSLISRATRLCSHVQDCKGVSASEMTYIVSSGALNSTHSLTHSAFNATQSLAFYFILCVCVCCQHRRGGKCAFELLHLVELHLQLHFGLFVAAF